MLSPELRAYQTAVIAQANIEIAAGFRRLLLVAPTASGKTVIVAAMIKKAVTAGRRVLVIAHRREIVAQTVAKLAAAGIEAGIIQAGFEPRPELPVQVASIQTLHARAIRGAKMEMPPADRLVIDEGHHARADTWQAVIDAYPGAIVLGLTATPCRQDGRGLGEIFQVIVECPQVAELTALGWLAPSRVYAPSVPDLSGVRIERGDYAEGQLARRMNTPELVGDLVEHWQRLAGRRRTVVFAVNIAHSLHIRDQFRAAGVSAEHLDGSTPIEERDAILRALAIGAVELVSNCMVLTEGWDCPEIGCLTLARPTKSLGLFRQMIGRVLRPAPGKVDALILDHAGGVFAHGLPDDQILWTLDEDRPAINLSLEKRRADGFDAALSGCPQCHAVRPRGRPCPVCGWTPHDPTEIAIADGELEEVRRLNTVDEQKHLYRQLLGIAVARGYDLGYAYHNFRRRYPDRKPPWAWRSLPPLEPGPDVIAWTQARARDYSRTRE